MIPQPITIGGRSGVLLYLNDDWKPVGKNKATLASVSFDDGGKTFFTVSPSQLRSFEFNPDQPRNEHGEWSNSNVDYMMTRIPSREMKAEGLPSSVSKAEDRIRFQQNEHGYFFYSDGRAKYYGSDDEHHIQFPEGWDKQPVKDAVFTHNHPMGSAFSPEDIYTAARLNLSEMRAVTAEGSYVMKRVGAEWPHPDFLRHAVEQADAFTREDFTQRLRDNRMTAKDANEQHFLRVWQQVTQEVRRDAMPSHQIVFSFEPKVTKDAHAH